MARRSIGQIALIIILGAMIGTLFGELISLVLPSGIVKEFFLRSAAFAVGPATLDVRLFSITVGFTVKLNIVGVLGIGAAIYMLRWY